MSLQTDNQAPAQSSQLVNESPVNLVPKLAFKTPRVFQIIFDLIGSAGGRDKTTRTVQYFAKFLISFLREYIIKGSKDKTKLTGLVIQLQRLAKNMSMFRKVLRFGKILQSYNSIEENSKQIINLGNSKPVDVQVKTNKTWLMLKIISEFNFALYCLSDHILYFWGLGIIKKNEQKFQETDKWNNIFWLINAIADILVDVVEIQQIKTHIQSLVQQNNGQGIAEIHKKFEPRFRQIALNLTRLICDIPLIIHFLDEKLITGIPAGILGTISSVIGTYQLIK